MPATIESPHTLIIPCSTYKITTGTWTLTNSSGILYQLKTATAETSLISIPIAIPRRDIEFGGKLTKIDVPLRITGANLSGVLVGTLYRVNMKAVNTPGTNIDATALTITELGTEVTLNAADRLYTATISNPAFDLATQDECYYQLDLSVPCAASTVVRAYSGIAYYNHLT